MAIRKELRKSGSAYVVDYYDPQGKRCRKAFRKAKDAQAFEAKVTSLKHEDRYNDVFEAKRENLTTFDELSDHYLTNFQGQKSFHRWKSQIIRVLRGTFGGKKLSEIVYLDLETFRNHRKATETYASKPRSEARVNREMAVLKHMLNKAVEWGWLEVSPFKRGSRLMFREKNDRLRFLTHEEADRLLTHCLPHLRPIVETALMTGMRKEELLSLKWEQIRNGYIYLSSAMTKGGKSRQIPVNDRLEEVLRALRQETQLRSSYVFSDSQGKRWGNVRKSFESACRKAGLTDFRFHDLRHTFASWLVMAGADIRSVQELLGHASLAMTMRYAHLAPGHLIKSINLIGRVKDDQRRTGQAL
jgi:integrase